MDCGRGQALCGGEVSGPGQGTWGPVELEPVAEPETGGAGAWVNMAATV